MIRDNVNARSNSRNHSVGLTGRRENWFVLKTISENLKPCFSLSVKCPCL